MPRAQHLVHFFAMVRDPTLYCCLTIVRIDFKLGVSKEGPIEQEAQALWHPIMLDWRRSTKAQASSFSWGTLEGNPKAVAILTGASNLSYLVS